MIRPGTQLAHYEILSAIGKGGMGEVWRARDTKLDREVAIKALPEEFAADRERLARFEREARLLASLNHPNIAAIYGLEEHEGARFLVLELVEGPTFADRIGQGAIPVEESLDLAPQIAEALEAAHGKGVIHRDLKPANIKLTNDGKVKVLDFGLAKAYAGPAPGASVSQSPTLSMAATQQGFILGTAAYMSPEQARGRDLDKRADIWAFGCVLFEMLTGRAAFPGDDVTDILAAVVRGEPEWAALPRDLEPRLRELLERCLEKNPRERWHDIADVRIALASAGAAARFEEPSKARRRSWKPVAGLALGCTVLGVALGLLFAGIRAPEVGGPAPDARVIGATILLPGDRPIASGTAAIGWDSPLVTLSPDGAWLVYVGQDGAGSGLYRRRLDRLDDPEPIPNTEGAIYAFFSPDGATVGFLTDDRMARVSLDGDDPQTLRRLSAVYWATWENDGWIYFQDNQWYGAVYRVRPEPGSEPERLGTARAVVTDMLPGGRYALGAAFASGIGGEYGAIVVVDLESGQVEELPFRGMDPRHLASGHLLFSRGGSLLAVAFDPEERIAIGAPVTVLRNVAMDSLFWHAQVGVADDGTLAWVPGADRGVGRFVTVDRDGGETVLPVPAGKYGVFDLSPDDGTLAIHVADVNDYILLYDLEREEALKLPGSDGFGWPKWSQDGRRVSSANGQLLGPREGFPFAVRLHDVSSGDFDDITTIYGQINSWAPGGDLWAATTLDSSYQIGFISAEELEMEPVPGPPANRVLPVFAPDGRWVAYTSDESGQYEIWGSSYPEWRPRQLSPNDGGIEPVWCGRCDELFYRRGKQWMSAPVAEGETLAFATTPREVFTVDDFIDTPGLSYDVSSDGERLFVLKRAEPAVDDRIHVIGNWFRELERLVPVGD